MFLFSLVDGLWIGSSYALMALGLSLIYGVLGILDIANAAAFTLGAYVGATVYGHTGSVGLAVVVAAITAGSLGWIVQRVVYVPILKNGPIVVLIASIGIFIASEEGFRLIFGPYLRQFNAPIPLPAIHVAQVYLTGTQLLIIMAGLLVLIATWFVLNKTNEGLAWRATAQDRETAEAMGIDGMMVIGRIFFIGYALAAIAGVLVGINYDQVYPTMGDIPAYKMLAIIVLGGLGNPLGTIGASLLIGIVETFTASYIGLQIPRDSIAFIALIVILLVRPQGLFARGALKV
ncbi:MAG: branched-chain amino acid ABC transporter permease [Chloroflexota bacterium]